MTSTLEQLNGAWKLIIEQDSLLTEAMNVLDVLYETGNFEKALSIRRKVRELRTKVQKAGYTATPEEE